MESWVINHFAYVGIFFASKHKVCQSDVDHVEAAANGYRFLGNVVAMFGPQNRWNTGILEKRKKTWDIVVKNLIFCAYSRYIAYIDAIKRILTLYSAFLKIFLGDLDVHTFKQDTY